MENKQIYTLQELADYYETTPRTFFTWLLVKFHHVVNEFIPLLLLMELSGMSKSTNLLC